jgi:putative transposase
VNGRKRHVVVDTLGLVLAVVVHSAAVQDRAGALAVLAKLLPFGAFPRLERVWADGGYAGRLVRFLGRWERPLGWVLEIVKRTDDMAGFVVLPKRWIVERTFAWLNRYRRLSKDYETLTDSSEAMIRIAMINLMVHRLAPG